MRSENPKKTLFIITMIVCFIFLTSAFSSAVTNTDSFTKRDGKNIQYENSDVTLLIRLESEDIQNLAETLQKKGFDIQWATKTANSIEVFVSSHEYSYLVDRGYDPVIVSKGRPFRDIQAEQLGDILAVPSGYLDLSQIYEQMNTTVSNYPFICTVIDITATYNANPTYGNRHLYAMKISDNVALDEDEPAFLIVSCHHCREIVTPVIALYAIEQLTSQYGVNPVITALVDSYEIWIAPVWNPDGYVHVFNVDNMWRKNRRYFPEYGSYGVDLNRNYPFGWSGSGAGSTDPFSETYRGPSVASEAETQTMIAWSNHQHFAKVIDYHSYGREVLWGYIPTSHTHPFDSFLKSEAIRQSTQAGYGGSVRIPSAEGEHYQWQLAMNGSYANLMETHTTFQPSYASAVAEATQIWPSIVWLLQRPISVSGNVRNASSGQPLQATITLQGITFPNGEHFISEPSFGRYHLFLPPGDYTIEFSVPEYVSQTHQVTVTLDSAEILDVSLQMINEPPETPTITGPVSGKAGTTYKYTFQTTDPDDDNVYYFIDWGDNTSSGWIGPSESGKIINVNHKWTEKGSYTIKAKAKDIYNAESSWGTLEIEMPVSSIYDRIRYTLRAVQQAPLLNMLLALHR